MDAISEINVTWARGDSVRVLERVAADPDAQCFVVSGRFDKTLAEECTEMASAFAVNTNPEVDVYSSVGTDQYMDAGNIAAFLSRKLRRKVYIRKIFGDRNDEMLTYPNEVDFGWDVANGALEVAVPWGTRDWNFQIAYQPAGTGHTSLIVSRVPP